MDRDAASINVIAMLRQQAAQHRLAAKTLRESKQYAKANESDANGDALVEAANKLERLETAAADGGRGGAVYCVASDKSTDDGLHELYSHHFSPVPMADNIVLYTAPAAPSAGVVSVDRGFDYRDGRHHPTVKVTFSIDDWKARDAFAAMAAPSTEGQRS